MRSGRRGNQKGLPKHQAKTYNFKALKLEGDLSEQRHKIKNRKLKMFKSWENTMTKQTLKQRSALLDHVNRAKEKLVITQKILDSERDQLSFYLRFRYVGLGLVQGSSILILLGMSLLPYFVTLWFGLLVYQITAYRFWFEDRKVYRLTKEKLDKGLGSNIHTVRTLKIKQKRELVYIIGNWFGLFLVGLNIYLQS